ncbi:MAG: hypothetical protein FJX76_17585 [Armatimonadetes bacterium]|nr:hypothetical protein [Armatimonadota bacterium]
MRVATLVVVVLCALLAARPSAASQLEDFYKQKYPEWQVELALRAVDDNFAHCSKAEREQALHETLAFFHVVFHETRMHHFEQNVWLIKQYHQEIARVCARYNVPFSMAISIMTWENGGHVNTTSWAACVGVGQISQGAVEAAHGYYVEAVRDLKAAAALCRMLAAVAKAMLPNDHSLHHLLRAAGKELNQMSATVDLRTRHAKLAKAAGQRDERVVPTCNIEDSVVFMRMLLDAYGGRPDLAISAYHNGISNNDDLLRDYLRRVDPKGATFTYRNRGPLLTAIKRNKITFVTLWNDRRCREMLNGLRTMDGDVTNDGNRSEALGDESDIYVWKCTGALVGYYATERELYALLDRYRGHHDTVETAGFRSEKRVTLKGSKMSVTPELAGYLASVQRRFKQRTGKPLPLSVLAAHDDLTHAEGIAVDVADTQPVLSQILNEDWLFDRIYKRRLPGGLVHVCINPRFGPEFLGKARAPLPTLAQR